MCARINTEDEREVLTCSRTSRDWDGRAGGRERETRGLINGLLIAGTVDINDRRVHFLQMSDLRARPPLVSRFHVRFLSFYSVRVGEGDLLLLKALCIL